jgi:pilus assembly protein Flp/PilA
MFFMRNLLTRFAKNDEGAALVEYGLLVALIALACFVSIQLLGTNLNTFFNAIALFIGGIVVPPAP